MNPIVAQQTALGNALVTPDNRVKIRKCNMRISPSKKPQKEPTYQVVLDALALSLCYLAFLITAKFKLEKKKFIIDVEVFRDSLQICPRLPNQEFDEPPSNEEIVSFVKELGYKGDIGSITNVFINYMHQPWRTFAAIINKCLFGKTTGLDKIRISRAQILCGMFYRKNINFMDLIWKDFMFQIDNRDSSAKRPENMPYPRFTKAIIQHFISKDKPISMRNIMFMHTEATPKKARKWKKPASPLKKQTLVITEEPAKKPAARTQPFGVQIKDTPVYDKHVVLVTNVKVNKWYGYGHVEEIEVRRSDQKLYKFMEGDFLIFHLNDIEDMLLLVVQNKLFNLNSNVIFDLVVALRMFTRRIVIQKRVEDLQLGVESYQKKLNISKPRTCDEDLSRRTPYTTLLDPQGVIYEDKLNIKRLMRSDELHKFSNGTLQSV
ncbi:hypothetical protein Tco_0291891 [Tanacetum coccineum]